MAHPMAHPLEQTSRHSDPGLIDHPLTEAPTEIKRDCTGSTFVSSQEDLSMAVSEEIWTALSTGEKCCNSWSSSHRDQSTTFGIDPSIELSFGGRKNEPSWPISIRGESSQKNSEKFSLVLGQKTEAMPANPETQSRSQAASVEHPHYQRSKSASIISAPKALSRQLSSAHSFSSNGDHQIISPRKHIRSPFSCPKCGLTSTGLDFNPNQCPLCNYIWGEVDYHGSLDFNSSWVPIADSEAAIGRPVITKIASLNPQTTNSRSDKPPEYSALPKPSFKNVVWRIPKNLKKITRSRSRQSKGRPGHDYEHTLQQLGGLKDDAHVLLVPAVSLSNPVASVQREDEGYANTTFDDGETNIVILPPSVSRPKPNSDQHSTACEGAKKNIPKLPLRLKNTFRRGARASRRLEPITERPVAISHSISHSAMSNDDFFDLRSHLGSSFITEETMSGIYSNVGSEGADKGEVLNRLMLEFYKGFHPDIRKRLRDSGSNNRGPSDGETPVGSTGSNLASESLPTTHHSTSSGNNSSSTHSRKRSNEQRFRDEGDEDDRDEDGNSKRPRLCFPDASHPIEIRFACPFYKRQPFDYLNSSGCPGPGWKEVHRLKDHLYKHHALPIRCKRCGETFESDDLLGEHQRAKDPCRVEEFKRGEGIDPLQMLKLKSRKGIQKLTQHEKWKEIYQILFPDDDPEQMPSPYYEVPQYKGKGKSSSPAPQTTELAEYGEFLLRELPAGVRQEFAAEYDRGIGPQEARLLDRLSDIVALVHRRLFRAFTEYRGSPGRLLVLSPSPAARSTESAPETDFDSIFANVGVPFMEYQSPNQTQDQGQVTQADPDAHLELYWGSRWNEDAAEATKDGEMPSFELDMNEFVAFPLDRFSTASDSGYYSFRSNSNPSAESEARRPP